MSTPLPSQEWAETALERVGESIALPHRHGVRSTARPLCQPMSLGAGPVPYGLLIYGAKP